MTKSVSSREVQSGAVLHDPHPEGVTPTTFRQRVWSRLLMDCASGPPPSNKQISVAERDDSTQAITSLMERAWIVGWD